MEVVNNTEKTSSGVFGLSTDVQAIIVGLLLVLVAILVLWKMRKFIVNSILGVIALFLLQFAGITIPINIITIIVAGVLGLIGVGIMVLLIVLGFTF
ncbi:MAG: pro-sigmaK processing inhibitor BofA family protein [Candidatus Micrarchaeota archaeon]